MRSGACSDARQDEAPASRLHRRSEAADPRAILADKSPPHAGSACEPLTAASTSQQPRSSLALLCRPPSKKRAEKAQPVVAEQPPPWVGMSGTKRIQTELKMLMQDVRAAGQHILSPERRRAPHHSAGRQCGASGNLTADPPPPRLPCVGRSRAGSRQCTTWKPSGTTSPSAPRRPLAKPLLLSLQPAMLGRLRAGAVPDGVPPPLGRRWRMKMKDFDDDTPGGKQLNADLKRLAKVMNGQVRAARGGEGRLCPMAMLC